MTSRKGNFAFKCRSITSTSSWALSEYSFMSSHRPITEAWSGWWTTDESSASSTKRCFPGMCSVVVIEKRTRGDFLLGGHLSWTCRGACRKCERAGLEEMHGRFLAIIIVIPKSMGQCGSIFYLPQCQLISRLCVTMYAKIGALSKYTWSRIKIGRTQ